MRKIAQLNLKSGVREGVDEYDGDRVGEETENPGIRHREIYDNVRKVSNLDAHVEPQWKV